MSIPRVEIVKCQGWRYGCKNRIPAIPFDGIGGSEYCPNCQEDIKRRTEEEKERSQAKKRSRSHNSYRGTMVRNPITGRREYVTVSFEPLRHRLHPPSRVPF